MNCTNCGAPLLPNEEKCSYCGSSTPYGEMMTEVRKQEKLRADKEELKAELKVQQKEREIERLMQEKERMRLDRARFKHVPILLMPVLYGLTMFFYGPYWYISRANSLNNLSASKGKKINKWLCVFYALLCIVVFFFPNEAEEYGITTEDPISDYWFMALIFAVGLSVWLAFRVRTILHDYAGGFSRNIFGLSFDPFIIMLFIAGPVYLQFEINRMIKRGLLSPKI